MTSFGRLMDCRCSAVDGELRRLMDSERIVRDRWERASGASHILRLDLFEVHAVKGDPFLDIQMF